MQDVFLFVDMLGRFEVKRRASDCGRRNAG